MTDEETLKAYDTMVEEYSAMVNFEKPDQWLQSFIDHVPAKGRVLDLGCGPGNSALHMKNAGLDVDATDASPEMVEAAKTRLNIDARVATFDDLNDIETYHGIWANFSLLHAPKSEFPRHLSNIHAALHPKGIFHIGMKMGNAEKRDRLNRLYSYYSEDELRQQLTKHGFEIIEESTGEMLGLAGDIEPWIIILTRKK